MQNGRDSATSSEEKAINPVVESFPALSEDEQVNETPLKLQFALTQADRTSPLENTPKFDDETQKVNWDNNNARTSSSLASSPLFQANYEHVVDLNDLTEQSPVANNKKLNTNGTSSNRRSVLNQLRVLDGGLDNTKEPEMDDTQPVNEQSYSDGNDTLIMTQTDHQFRTPVVSKFALALDAGEDSTQPVNRMPFSVERETVHILNAPATVVRGRPITQVLGTPYIDNNGPNSETTSTPTASGDKEAASFSAKRSFKSIAEEDEEKDEDGNLYESEKNTFIANDTITSDQEMEDHSLHSSGDIVSSPDRSQPKRLRTNNHEKSTSDAEKTSSNRSSTNHREQERPHARKSPGFTPEHSRMRMPHFDEPGQTTPTKTRFPSGTNHISYREENGVWLPWNDGKWWAVRVAQGAPRNVADLFQRDDYSANLLLIDSSDNETNTSSSSVKRLDLVVGDKVKSKVNKKSNYEIIELVRSSSDISSTDIVCQGGYDKVKLRSIVSGGAKKSNIVEEIVPVYSLYMTVAQVKDYLDKREKSKVLYMSEKSSAKFLDTSLPERKSKTMTFAEPSSSLDSGETKNGSMLFENRLNDNDQKAGIFRKCVFALSSIEGDEFTALRNAIVRNGGSICQKGLKELFNISTKTFVIEWDSKILPDRFFFGAVLSKNILRTPKYLEAVALGWPCLSWRYIDDCVKSGDLIDWNPYVLAAGYSEVLDDSPRSLDVSFFNDNYSKQMHLRDQFIARRKIMANIRIPIYIIDHVSNQEEAIKTLLLYMGATNIKQAPTTGQIPRGSIVVDLSMKSGDAKSQQTSELWSYTSDIKIIKNLMNEKVRKLSQTIRYSREWVIQSAINGRVV